ncbi:MAG: AlpA family phage regulatory protein [Deltaproteobacteria bacterium]|jgi:predicted DNA-binding transcriptional regulator AlpA|nr:AlpA family phage regulatory protein [Deltaproteobacteria bacterium]
MTCQEKIHDEEQYLHDPDHGDQYLRLPAVRELLGVKTTSIYKFIKTHNFPKQIKIGDRISVWSKRAILEWIEACKKKGLNT